MNGFQPKKLWGRDNPYAHNTSIPPSIHTYDHGSYTEVKQDFIQSEDIIVKENEAVIQSTPYKNNVDRSEEQIQKRYIQDFEEKSDIVKDEIDIWLDGIKDNTEQIKITSTNKDKYINVEDIRKDPIESLSPDKDKYSQQWSFHSDGTITIIQQDSKGNSEKLTLSYDNNEET